MRSRRRREAPQPGGTGQGSSSETEPARRPLGPVNSPGPRADNSGASPRPVHWSRR